MVARRAHPRMSVTGATITSMTESEPRMFYDLNLRNARFVQVDLSGAVLRGVVVSGVEIDSPWLGEGEGLVVNGVDVTAYVDAELDRRFPGRADRHAGDPAGLRAAWESLEGTWSATLDRAATLPEGTVDESVEGEWSFAQTLRHLVLATDMWLGKAVLRHDQPFHPLGLMDAASEDDRDETALATGTPSYAEVLDARADRVAMVGDHLASVTSAQLAEARPNPHSPEHSETVLSCLHTIFDEEWEHLRYAVRDLDAIAARSQ